MLYVMKTPSLFSGRCHQKYSEKEKEGEKTERNEGYRDKRSIK